jgi:hypothetical protein
MTFKQREHYRYRVSHGDPDFPLREGFKPRPDLTHAESRAINACAKRRGIKGVGNISRYTVVGGIRFE